MRTKNQKLDRIPSSCRFCTDDPFATVSSYSPMRTIIVNPHDWFVEVQRQLATSGKIGMMTCLGASQTKENKNLQLEHSYSLRRPSSVICGPFCRRPSAHKSHRRSLQIVLNNNDKTSCYSFVPRPFPCARMAPV